TLLDSSGKTFAHFPASTGSKHDPLPLGSWKIQGVARNPVFHYNPQLFWDANPKHGKAKIPPGPNNPVGVVWIDLSKPHYGIHGTPEPSKVGKTESHGCIRLTNWDVAELATAVAASARAGVAGFAAGALSGAAAVWLLLRPAAAPVVAVPGPPAPPVASPG